MRTTAFLACILLLVGCNYSKLNEEFRLKVGQSATVNKGQLSFTFESFSDGRCPEDAVCVWEGDATVVLKYDTGERDTLHTNLEPKAVAHNNHQILLVYLSPYPRVSRPTSQNDYVARIMVTRIDDGDMLIPEGSTAVNSQKEDAHRTL